MEHGKLAGNDSINDRIYACLATLDPCDVTAFVRKFRRDADEQNFHTYRELLLGSHLRQRGWEARYEQPILGRNPDWLIPPDGDAPREIVDVVTLHQRRATDAEIGTSVLTGSVWPGWLTIPADHVLSKLDQKVGAYRRVASVNRLPYTVAAFSEFTASLEREEIRYVLYEHHDGLFTATLELSGIVFFRERNGSYEFTYFANAQATLPSRLFGDA